jgi:hypothetical protein
MEVKGQKTNRVRLKKEKKGNGKGESMKKISIHGKRNRRAVTTFGEIESYFQKNTLRDIDVIRQDQI